MKKGGTRAGETLCDLCDLYDNICNIDTHKSEKCVTLSKIAEMSGEVIHHSFRNPPRYPKLWRRLQPKVTSHRQGPSSFLGAVMLDMDGGGG